MKSERSSPVRIRIVRKDRAKIEAREDVIRVLHEYMSLFDPESVHTYKYKKGLWDGKVCFLSSGNTFPIGLLPRIYNFIKNSYGLPELVDERKGVPKIFTQDNWAESLANNIPTVIGDKELRDYQYEIAFNAVTRKFVKEDIPFLRGIVYAATNAGKSLISAAICRGLEDRMSVLYLCHRHEILSQVVNWYGKYLNTPIGIYNVKNDNITPVTVGMITTFYARKDSKETSDILKSFDCIIVDEAHHLPAPSWSWVLQKANPYSVFAMSGTAFQSGSIRNVSLVGLSGPILYKKITNKFLVDNQYSASPNIIMYKYKCSKLNKDREVSKLSDTIRWLLQEKAEAEQDNNILKAENCERLVRNARTKLYSLVYSKGVSTSSHRLKPLLDIYEKNKGKSILTIVIKKEHGEFIKSRRPEATYINGDDTPERRDEVKSKFISGEIKELIATMIYKEGIDIPCIDILVLACGESSPNTILQTFGRGLRRSENKNTVDVYDFYDTSYRLLKRHSDYRKKIYVRDGFKPKIVSW